MSSIRVRNPGNNPETRVFCDWTNSQGDHCRSLPPTDYDAKEARKLAKTLGWTRVNRKDYCPEHQQH